MTVLIYIDKETYNEATSHYISIIAKAIERVGHQTQTVDTWKNISPTDYVFILTYKHFFYTYYFARCKNIIFWFQGILPEEIKLEETSLRSKLKYLFYTYLEKIILSRSKFVFFVSNPMRMHFYEKCGYDRDNYIIMPCFNKAIREESFHYEKKYTTPTFVYIGTLYKWQCVNETLDLYEKIEKRIKNAKLVLLTKEIDKAKKLVAQKEINNVEIDFIPLEKLDLELQKYKYAFLLRHNIAVNRVATPTKMNAYLANGLIPVYSDVIETFNNNITLGKYFVKVKKDNVTDDIIDSIGKIESEKIDPSQLFEEYNRIFKTFYNEEKYLIDIERAMSSILK